MANQLHRGEWLWLCREGNEADLVEELTAVDRRAGASLLASSLVRSGRRPEQRGRPVELAFARQVLPVAAIESATSPDQLGQAIAAWAIKLEVGHLALQVFTPDSEVGNRWAAQASRAEEVATRRLEQSHRRVLPPAELAGRDRLVQACLIAPDRAALGALAIGASLSLAPGGRRRFSAPREAPSRAAAKLLEAIDWLGRQPEPGELCIDLGAAPGGWSHVLLDLRARVLAVDPARLAPSLARHKRLHHIQCSAFEYLPEEPADWLFCDMAWRPLEVAALLAKWGRQGAARFLIANIKLPMKKKVDLIRRIKEILATGGWRDLRVRQLYHDRDEVTLGAWRIG